MTCQSVLLFQQHLAILHLNLENTILCEVNFYMQLFLLINCAIMIDIIENVEMFMYCPLLTCNISTSRGCILNQLGILRLYFDQLCLLQLLIVDATAADWVAYVKSTVIVLFPQHIKYCICCKYEHTCPFILKYLIKLKWIVCKYTYCDSNASIECAQCFLYKIVLGTKESLL